MNLKIRKESNVSALDGFRCGVPAMDGFIRDQLAEVLNLHKCSLFTVADEQQGLVAFFVLSEGFVLDNQIDFDEQPSYGEPFAIFKDGKFANRTRYSTIEIEYLAVREDCRNQHIGTAVVRNIFRLAVQMGVAIVTVDAYYNEAYSAIPFYDKCGFVPLEDFDNNPDTLRMGYVIM